MMNFLKKHEQLIQMALSSNMLPAFLDILSEQITSDFSEKIKIGVKKGIPVPASPEIVASFFTGAIVHTIKWWLIQKKQIPEEKLVQEIEKILIAWY